MKKYVAFLTVVLLLILTGCRGGKADQSMISIDKKGKVQAITVESFNKSYYSLEELEKMVNEAVKKYNDSQDGEKIEVRECKEDEKKGRVFLKLTYASCFDYKEFNQRELYAGTMEDAAGTYDFDTVFVDREGNECDAKLVLAQSKGAKVIVLQEPIAVETAGNILYVSENVEIQGGKVAKVKSDGNQDNENADTCISDYAYIIYENKA